ncbi:hypothetical protein JOE65_000269 [Arthrobacter roseus]|nr:hypothetical protein [Arthrobacter roseus]
MRAAVILSLPVAFLMDSLTLWHLLIAVSLMGVADVFFTTAHTTVLPLVVDRHQLSVANARLQSAQSAIGVGSPVLSSSLLAVIAAPFALLTSAVAYLCSALSVARMRLDSTPSDDDAGRPPFWASAKEGLAFTVAHPILRPLFLSGMITNAAVMFGNAAMAVYALTVLQLDAALFAGLGIFSALGALVGSLTVVPVLNRLGIGRTKILCSLMAMPAVALVPLADVLPAFAVVLLAVSGFGWAYLIVATSVAGSGIMPRVTPARMLGSVSVSNRLFVLGIMPLASVAGGALGVWLGVVPVLWMWAVLAGLSAVPILLSPMRSWRDFPPEHDFTFTAGQLQAG